MIKFLGLLLYQFTVMDRYDVRRPVYYLRWVNLRKAIREAKRSLRAQRYYDAYHQKEMSWRRTAWKTYGSSL